MHPEVEYLIELLRRNREEGVGCALLIGAGCSVTAGIPTANEIVKVIENKYKPEYARAVSKGRADYPGCMAELPIHYRRKLIDSYIAKARINWAHIHIARLIMAGVIDRVLTTNFDPLLVRACALFNHFPPVYDMAMMTGFQPQRLPRDGSAIFHLHGTRDGFVQAHDEREVQAMRAKLTPLFQHCRERPRTWIVVGYSGACDPVFEQLLAVPQYDLNLYWADYENTMSPDVATLVDDEQRRAYWIPDQDADNFFATLAEELDCDAPMFLTRPFTHLGETLENIVGMRDDDKEEHKALLSTEFDPRPRIRRAIECVEPHNLCRADNPISPEQTPPPSAPTSTAPTDQSNDDKPKSVIAAAMMRLLAKDWAGVLALGDKLLADGGITAVRMLVSAKIEAARAALDAAKGSALNDARRQELWNEAESLLREASEYSQVKHIAFNIWGNLLSEMATNCRERPQADALRKSAAEKYEAALVNKPDYHHALGNLSLVLMDQAEACDDPTRRDELLRDVVDNLNRALAIKPDYFEALGNLSLALMRQSDSCDDPARRDELLRDAVDKLNRALAIKPDYIEALSNLSVVLMKQAHACADPARRDELLRDAVDQLNRALAIKPDDQEVLVNLSSVLMRQTDACDDPARQDQLLHDAVNNLNSALAIKPDDHEALFNLSLVLMRQADACDDSARRDELLRDAVDKLNQALAIKPDDHEALVNLSVILMKQADSCDDPAQRDELLRDAVDNLNRALAIKPDYHQALFNLSVGLMDQADVCDDPARRDELLRDAGDLLNQALAIKPDDFEALSNLSHVLMKQAVASPDRRESLLNEAEELLGRVNAIVPSEGDYDLACLAALRGDEETCRFWLESSRANGTLTSRSHLETDPDLESVRECDWFKALLEQAKAN